MPDRTAQHFLENGGTMAAAIREFAWAATSLGPMAGWPIALRTTLAIMLASKFPMAVVWGEDLTTFHNDAFTPILGEKPAALGRSFREVWHEAWPVIEPILAKAFVGEATYIEDFPLTVERRGFAEQAYFTFCYSPIRDETGQVAGILDTVVETTDKVRAQNHARVLNQELGHRLQNTMAMVSAIAQQTFRAGKSPREMQEALAQRLSALGRAHSILTGTGWSGASIRAVVEGALAAHATNPDQVSMQGPDVDLSAKHALSLALALHELATNAVKYGALSVETGHVAIRWEAGVADDLFRLTWSEAQGPAVRATRRRGFGSRLLEEVLAGEFGGKVRIERLPAGLKFVLTTRMRYLIEARQSGAGIDLQAPLGSPGS